MPGVNVTELTKQIDTLLNEHKTLRGRSQYDDLSDLYEEQDALAVRLQAAIRRLAPGSNTYIAEMESVTSDLKNSTGYRIRVCIGILQALRADAQAGWLEGIAELLHADTFNDFLDQASELLDKNYKDAVAVVIGSVLETHIRLLCVKFGVNTQLSAGQAKKADMMNADLVKAGAYNNLVQKAITGWLAIRNAAAHGEYGKYNKDNVVGMLASVRDFIIQHPA